MVAVQWGTRVLWPCAVPSSEGFQIILMNKRVASYLGKLTLVFLIHCASGVLALSSQLVVFAETLTWLPAGIALAAILLWGRSMWPAVAAGALVTTLYGHGPFSSGLISAVANVAGPLASSWLLERVDFRPSLSRIRDVVQLAIIGSMMGPFITATIGAVVLKGLGRFASRSFLEFWWLWWRGDSLAILLVTPCLLVWFSSRPPWSKKKLLEALSAAAMVVVVSLLVFGIWPFHGLASPPTAYLHFPLLIWVAMRLGIHGTSAANLLLLMITGWGTAAGIGPFATPSLETTLVLHWAFLGATSLSSLILAATVTEQRATREALEHSDDRYRDFMEHSPDGIWRIELEKPLSPAWPEKQQIDHAIQYNVLAECNDAFAQMYGFKTSREVVGKKLQDLFSFSDPGNLDFVRSVIRSGYRIHQQETREINREGRVKYFLNNIAGIIERGKLVRLWGTQRDVTENRMLEDQLRQAQKMEAVGRLAGGVAHDFNNLLMVIGGHGELLRDEAATNPMIAKHTESILKAADRAGMLTRQLLAFGRKQVLQPKILDINHVVQDTGKLLRRVIGEHIELIFSLSPSVGHVKADPGQIEQVLMNLTINARDAMPHGGKLTIETADSKLSEEYQHDHPAVVPGDYVLLQVSDTGTGMDEKTRAQIFEPFFTTKERGQGTGLGLATVYGIVKQSGGYIWAYSEPGAGSTFKVYLPRVAASAESVRPATPEAIPRGNETILVAEDEPGVRELACDFLQSHGYNVLQARDPAHALKLAEDNPARVQLLLSDVVMPGMRGTELAARVTQLNPAIRVLFVSGYTDNSIVQQGFIEPGTNFLSKPFSREALLRKVRQVLDLPARPVVRG